MNCDGVLTVASQCTVLHAVVSIMCAGSVSKLCLAVTPQEYPATPLGETHHLG